VTRVLLPPAPLRMEFEPKRRDDASLGYSLTLSSDERRLYVARHALGAWGTEMWFGSPTVDVLLTKDDSPLAPTRKPPGAGMSGSFGVVEDAVLTMGSAAFVQPRALVYRRSANTVLVIGEGTGVVEELDALSMDPTVMKRRTTVLFDDATRVMCAAPSGLALSSDERTAYVFCRANNVLSVVRYGALKATGKPDVTNYSLGEGPKDAAVAAGRKLYYDATDLRISGGLSCAGCHPDGRDDGFTWSEGTEDDINQRTFLADFSQSPNGGVGFPRQTPMLAGRVSAPGPYGWHGESTDLPARVAAGFRLHRWTVFSLDQEVNQRSEAVSIAAFVRRGLVPPPRPKGELSDAA
jgi:hypothetical protein